MSSKNHPHRKYFASPESAYDAAKFWRRKRSIIASAVVEPGLCQETGMEIVTLEVIDVEKFNKFTDGMECVITDTLDEMKEIVDTGL